MEDKKRNFMEIYETYYPKIYRYLTRLVGESDAEDLTQEVFLMISRALGDFKGESKISTWLYRIATNAALDKLRTPLQNRMVQIGSLDSDLEEVVAETTGQNAWTGEKASPVEHQVFHKEMKDCIQAFIESLPNDYRTVLLLSEFEGFKDSEIAGILGISPGMVKIRLHRARERLKRKLEQNCGSYWIEDNEFIPELKIV